MENSQKTVLAAASSGPYWDELILLAPVFGQSATRYVTTHGNNVRGDEIGEVQLLPDARLSRPLSFLACLFAALRIVSKFRPDVVVSTGAAPGLACILAGRMFGARTLWIDSLVHREKLSLCGRVAKRIADGCWTQWEHLSDGKQLKYFGSTV